MSRLVGLAQEYEALTHEQVLRDEIAAIIAEI